MDTPVPSDDDGLAPLYGEGCRSINRRAIVGGFAALSFAAPLAAKGARSIRRLAWTATARTEIGGRILDLRSTTSLELPLLRVRSTSYVGSEGPATARTLILEPDGAWVEYDGKRSELPPPPAIHLRQQYAIYAWLLLVQQGKRPKPGPLALSEPPYPDIAFMIGADGYPLSADVTVDAPGAGESRIDQHVTFSGRIDSNGVRWPRHIAIAQGGKPYSELTFTSFSAR